MLAGSWLLIRTTPEWRRLLAIAGVFVVFQFVLDPFSIAIYATNLPSIPLGSATPADRGFAYQNVRLTTADGVQLAAWWIPSHNGTAVVLLHGAGRRVGTFGTGGMKPTRGRCERQSRGY